MSANVSREIEAKFRVHPPFEIPDLLDRRTGAATIDPPVQHELRAVYWDTNDLRLAREGITLRHRDGEGATKDGWHLKLPIREGRVPDASTASRDELHVHGPHDTIPDELRSLLLPWSRTAVLGPVATLRTQRTAYLLRDRAGAPLVELTDDLVSVVSSGRVAGRFREIEVEDRGGGIGAIEAVGSLLRSGGAVGGEFMPKVVRALGPQATAEPDPPLPHQVALTEPAHVAIRDMLRRDVRHLIGLDLAVRRGLDDGVHQMRVTTRRLRSVLKTFKPLLDPEWAGSLRRELSWLADALGAARDHEVLLARLSAQLDALPPELIVGPVRARLDQVIGAGLSGGQQEALAMLSSEQYVVLLERLVDAAWEPLTSPAADEPTGTAIPDLIRKSWRKLAAGVAALDADGADTKAWHQVRIEAKRLRYCCDAAEAMFGTPAKGLARQAKHLTETLGEHQDAVIAAAQLRSIATSRGGGPVAFTLGVLHAGQLDAASRARDRFRHEWAQAARRRHRRWLTGAG
jgi:CHAD domain-containing protein